MADQNKKQYIKYENTTYIIEDHRLPDPTAADNGKVLGVANGEYALKQEEGGSGAVTSVNGKTGAVTLSASDVGALPDSTVIPTVPQMATAPDMTDWTAGKTVDAAVLKTTVTGAALQVAALEDEVNALESAGFQTAQQVQTAIAAIPDELPTVTASDNGKVLGVVNGAWAAKVDEGGSSAPFEIPIAKSGSTYTTTASAADILANIDNCVITVDGMVVIPSVYTRTGSFGIIMAGIASSLYGYVNSENYQIIVQNDTVFIQYFEADAQSELPSGGSTGDFLRKTASGVAWETVPSAESNSFGGGS